jgi:hypothetical protein
MRLHIEDFVTLAVVWYITPFLHMYLIIKMTSSWSGQLCVGANILGEWKYICYELQRNQDFLWG